MSNLEEKIISELKASKNKEVYTWLIYVYRKDTKATLHIILQMIPACN